MGLRPIEKKGVIVVRRARERAAFKSRGPSVKRGAGGRQGKRGARIEQSNDWQRAPRIRVIWMPQIGVAILPGLIY